MKIYYNHPVVITLYRGGTLIVLATPTPSTVNYCTLLMCPSCTFSGTERIEAPDQCAHEGRGDSF